MIFRERRDIDDVAQEKWDVVVVGAGPSGAMTAREVALNGARVLLVDRAAFPRYKVCGCCLNTRATGILHSAGLGTVLTSSEASPLHDFRLAVHGRSATVGLNPGGVAIPRSVLDDALVQAAIDAGVVFLDETIVHIDSIANDFQSLHLTARHAKSLVQTRIAVAADGISQGLLRELAEKPSFPRTNSYIGAGAMVDDSNAEFEHGTIYMACGAGGYVGFVRVGDGNLNVAAALSAEFVRAKGGLALAACSIASDAGFSCPTSMAISRWRGTPPLTRRASTLSGHRFFVVGDAAGYVEPFTGEGMAWALSAAKAIAPFVLAGAKKFDSKLSRDWSRAHRRLVSRSHRRCKLITAALRRPRLVGLAVNVVGWAPQLAAPLVNELNGASTIKPEY